VGRFEGKLIPATLDRRLGRAQNRTTSDTSCRGSGHTRSLQQQLRSRSSRIALVYRVLRPGTVRRGRSCRGSQGVRCTSVIQSCRAGRSIVCMRDRGRCFYSCPRTAGYTIHVFPYTDARLSVTEPRQPRYRIARDMCAPPPLSHPPERHPPGQAGKELPAQERSGHAASTRSCLGRRQCPCPISACVD
jgi:hypothetical protein